MEILTKEWNAYIDSMKKAVSEEENWQKELDGCLEMAEAAKKGDEGALLDLIACKAEAGIDFEESVEFSTKRLMKVTFSRSKRLASSIVSEFSIHLTSQNPHS